MAGRGQTVVQVTGGRELRRRLRTIEGGLDRLKDAHREVARTVLSGARPSAPVRTGRLAGSGRASGTNTMSIIRYGGARIPYGGPIHYGWPARHIAPQPWLLNEAQRSEPLWLARYNEHVRQLVEETSA
jgi:hypothetical protein